MPSKTEQLQIIQRMKNQLKNHHVVKRMFQEWDADIELLDLMPMAFADLEVSARTDHGIIYFNSNLLKDGFDNDDHYMVHELTHGLQQCFGDHPTTGGSDGDDYVSNKYEVEGFQNQTEYLSDEYNDTTAERYVERVLDHHKLHGTKRKHRKDVLLQLASKD